MNLALVENRVSNVKNLPSPPEVAITLLRILADADTKIDQVSATMARDPALAAGMLRIVNSSYYGLRHRVSSLSRALSLLGYRTVKNIVLTAAAAGVFQIKNVTKCFDPQAFARHSVAAAAVCRFLAKFYNGIDPDTAFSAGLLHDIGKMAMDQCFPAEYEQAVEAAKRLHVPVYKAEQEVWGFDHAAVGRILAERWKLPEDLCEAIAYHHDMAGAPDRKLIAICYIADYVCAVKALSAPDRSVPAELDHQAWENLRLDSRILPELLTILDQEIREASLMFMSALAADPAPVS